MIFPTDIIGHIPPLPRIDMYGPKPAEPKEVGPVLGPYVSEHEQKRIWAITRQSAEGCNVPQREAGQ